LSFEIREVTAADILSNVALVRAHHEELAAAFSGHAVNPDVERYARLTEQGALLCLGAFVDGEMVGYTTSILSTHSHYAGLLCAFNDAIYMAPQHRAEHGVALRRRTRDAMKARGAHHALWYAKPDTALALLLAAERCTLHEIMFHEGL
jgi:predicted GNAT superfamily acetyltransferase